MSDISRAGRHEKRRKFLSDRNEVNEILKERGDRYGSFADNAKLTQKLKKAIIDATETDPLPPFQQESIDMIFHKISRCVYGDRYYIDNWNDIVGYAQLALDELKRIHDASTN